mgnify:CR=1 FL=1|tara:strand:- start:857 stop:1111 length:255 start_codon:yes stop_codon:yes gene_type:complete
MQPFDRAWMVLKNNPHIPEFKYFPRGHRALARATEYAQPPLRGGPFYLTMPRPTPPPENYAHRTEQMPASSEEYMEELKQGNSE